MKDREGAGRSREVRIESWAITGEAWPNFPVVRMKKNHYSQPACQETGTEKEGRWQILYETYQSASTDAKILSETDNKNSPSLI